MRVPLPQHGDRTGGPRRRARASLTLDDVVRGATAVDLARPAGELLAAVTWEGMAPDPEVLDAATFLAWL